MKPVEIGFFHPAMPILNLQVTVALLIKLLVLLSQVQVGTTACILFMREKGAQRSTLP